MAEERIEREREFEIRSSSQDIRAFMGTDIWADLESELRFRLEIAQAVLETTIDTENMLRTQGAVGELRLLLDLPESLAADVETNERKRRESKEGKEKYSGRI